MKNSAEKISGDLDTPRFNNSELMWVTGLSLATVQTWVNRGLIRIQEQNPGHGRRRLYSARNLFSLAIAARLAESKLPISDAFSLGKHVDLDSFFGDLQNPDGLTWIMLAIGDGG